MMFWLLVVGIIVLSVVGGMAGAYLLIDRLGRQRTQTHLSRTGYFCEADGCAAEALPHRTYDGRRLCVRHKGAA